MKIRTINDLESEISKDLAWRKKELIAIKANITQARNFAKNTALRSGIALLYAHWEGLVKNVASYYLIYVANLKLPYSKLTNNFIAISMKEKIILFENTNKTTLQTKLLNEIFGCTVQKSNIPTTGVIKTSSNLKSDVFEEILATIGLDSSSFSSSYNLIDEVLLKMRNEIAHGERIEYLNLDEARYFELHDRVLELITLFSNEVLNAAVLELYLKA